MYTKLLRNLDLKLYNAFLMCDVARVLYNVCYWCEPGEILHILFVIIIRCIQTDKMFSYCQNHTRVVLSMKYSYVF